MSTHSFVRVDCKAFAKCGVKSLSHCRRYRGEDNYCKGCTLIRRKPRNRKFDAGGREMKNVPIAATISISIGFTQIRLLRMERNTGVYRHGAVCVCHRLIARGQSKKKDSPNNKFLV